MKTRIVMWGHNEKDEKVLIAIALRTEDNVVDVFTFPFEAASEEFYNLMLNEWREAHDITFPEHIHIEIPLTVSGRLLPEGLTVDRNDIIQRAQSEWHFVVLSDKLYRTFLSELQDFRERISQAGQYQNQWWEEMKQSWERIQKNIFDKTLMRDHGQQLREVTNEIFAFLKQKRKAIDNEAERMSTAVAERFTRKLDEVDEKLNAGLGLQPLFNDLKKMQEEFKGAALSRADRSRLWKRMDTTFKAVKEKKFGARKIKREGPALERLDRRYQGLLSAIDKMEKSIHRDEQDRHVEDERIANADSQLEAQIRVAKLRMIDERLQSKKEKLAEMLKTKSQLDERINREKKYQEEQQRKQVLKEELKEAKETVKQKIAETIHIHAEQQDTESLEKAAEAITTRNRKDPGDTIGAIAEDVAGAIRGE